MSSKSKSPGGSDPFFASLHHRTLKKLTIRSSFLASLAMAMCNLTAKAQVSLQICSLILGAFVLFLSRTTQKIEPEEVSEFVPSHLRKVNEFDLHKYSFRHRFTQYFPPPRLRNNHESWPTFQVQEVHSHRILNSSCAHLGRYAMADASTHSLTYAIGITSEVATRLRKVADHHRQSVEGKSGHNLCSLPAWLFTTLMLEACEDTTKPSNDRQHVLQALFSQEHGPQHAKLCRLNWKQQQHWHTSRGKPVNKTAALLHVVIPYHMLNVWEAVEQTLLRQGAQIVSKELMDAKKHSTCIVKSTMPMLANVIFCLHNEEKLAEVPRLLQKYTGREEQWLRACLNKRVCPGLMTTKDEEPGAKIDRDARKRLDSPGLLQTEEPDKELDLLDASNRLDQLLNYLDERKAKAQKLREP